MCDAWRLRKGVVAWEAGRGLVLCDVAGRPSGSIALTRWRGRRSSRRHASFFSAPSLSDVFETKDERGWVLRREQASNETDQAVTGLTGLFNATLVK